MKYALVKSFAAKCHRLAFNLSKVKTPPSYSQQALFAAGNDVDAIALETILKPHHTMVATSTPHGDWLATESAIANGITKINQATFKVGETYIRVDSIDLECMKLTEVKAGSSVKGDYIIDLALQEIYLRQVGVRNDEFSLILREKSFVTGCQWNEALREVDVTSDVKSLLEQDDFIHFVEVFEAGYDSAPQPVFGKVCKTCDFKKECWSELEHPSFLIPGLSDKLMAHIIEHNAYELSRVSSDVLTQNQLDYKHSTLNSEISISKSGLTADLSQFASPIAHCDFEAFNLPFSPSPGVKTFSMVPFQASIHLEDDDGSASHFEHLCNHQFDDRESLAKFLVDNLSDVSTIVTWNVSFERRMIQYLANAVPKYSDKLGQIIGKLVDLNPVVKANVKHYAFKGSYSLKSVAPALCPEFSYMGLDIDNGNDANGIFQLLTRGMVPQSEIPKIRKDLFEYCRNDTAATHAILKELRKLSKGEEKNEVENYARA